MRVAVPLLCAGLLACALTVPLALQTAGTGSGPVLVVAAPWGGGPAAVVERAGGRVVGPGEAPLGVVAAGAAPGALRAAGAWLVLDAARVAALCGQAGWGRG